MNAFEHLVKQISQKARAPITTQILRSEYQIFCKEYLFDNLKGKRFGQAFCERFNIVDYILIIEPSTEYSKNYIIKAGYVTK